MKKQNLSKKKRVVVKIGSNSLVHKKTGRLDYIKLERLVREICDLRNRGMDVCLVSSGAIAVGRQTLGYNKRPKEMALRQALASVGQARLMSVYQTYFSEYNQDCGQVLMTKNTMLDNVSRKNAQNTFEKLFELGVIPVVNANDTVSTYEIQFGDNDTLAAVVTSLVHADLLILLSDIDGLYTDDPKKNEDATLVPYVDKIDDKLKAMASETPGSSIGTGGMTTKIRAAQITTASGADMIIANGADVSILHHIFEEEYVGTFFKAHKDDDFFLQDVLEGEIG
ncbi:MAG: glutamate 5-kinase [Lachnospiraceae bacterium]|nr:glutamate 5-kinase [Lachnospiraceae bacterium]